MALVKRSDVPRLVLPAEAVTVGAFGGDVEVRGLPLWQWLEVRQQHAKTPARAASEMLAVAVVDADGKPIYSAAEWDAFSTKHRADYVLLLGTVQRLSGADGESNEKN